MSRPIFGDKLPAKVCPVCRKAYGERQRRRKDDQWFWAYGHGSLMPWHLDTLRPTDPPKMRGIF